MRKYLLAAVAAAAIASPAVARDGSGYVGADIGAMIAEDSRYDFTDATQSLDDFVVLDYSTGIDLDLNGGYDFGMFRVEGELAYKRAPADEIRVNAGGSVVDSINDADGSTKVLSAMINGLVDMGNQDSFSGFVGAGIGLAKVKADVSFSGDFPSFPDDTDFDFDDSDSTMAWQVLAGVRYAVSPNIDVGFKYRYFNTGTYKFSDDSIDAELKDKWRSHSFMLSFAYNFYSPPPPPPAPPPPPPPPPPPATQTCPDGSVVLATEACPAPPPPPPPPPPAPERG